MVSETLSLRIQEPCLRHAQEPGHASKWFSNSYRIQEPCHIYGKSLSDNSWRLEYFIVFSKQFLFRCDWVPTIYKMDSTTFMVKLFATKVGSLIIVTKSCILGEAAFKMNNYLTYFEAESSNAQFLCNFAFPFFKFCITFL